MARILVVDDTRNIRKMVNLTLRGAGHEVTGAEDGKRGLAAFGNGREWDLVLLDQRMPFATGQEMAAEIRARSIHARVIMMTAFATAELAGEMIAGGALDFLRKPFSTEILRCSVEKALAPAHRGIWEENALHEVGASRPQITLLMKGFYFWPVLLEEVDPPAGLEVGRPFWVEGHGEKRWTLVGVTPHVREQIQRETGLEFPKNSHVWNTVCELALSQFLFENAVMPPRLLPIFELTDSQLFTIQKIGRDARFPGFR